MKKFELDTYKENIIKSYLNENLSCAKIAAKFNCSLSGIYDALKRWNISTRGLSVSHKKYFCDENFFNKINSEEKAYWLGFIYADGYLTKPNKFGIALNYRDIGHLDKLKRDLKSNYRINIYKSTSPYGSVAYARLLISSNNIYSDLVDKGVALRKSLILKYPNIDVLSSNFYRHFIRGYFDGDGSLVLSDNSINFKICGTKEFLLKVVDIFNELKIGYKYQYKFYKRYEDNKNTYYISYGGVNKIYPIFKYMYENSNIYLDRKYSRYLKLKQHYEISNGSRL